MTAGQLLVLVGGLLQLAGVLVTAFGAVATWNRFRPGEKVLAPVIDPIERSRQRVLARIRRALGRAKTHQVSAVGVASTSVVADAVHVRKQWNKLPSDMAHQDAIEELDNRTRELINKVYENDDHLDSRLSELHVALQELREQHANQVQEQQETSREVAAGGIRIVLGGLAATGLGIAVVTVGSVPPIA